MSTYFINTKYATSSKQEQITIAVESVGRILNFKKAQTQTKNNILRQSKCCDCKEWFHTEMY